ncbi:hypothetical protein BXZ70DRAFT_962867 [Cristinia sonorae]|uniref:F-box domain-containing protein n=1 Tax=Cristinia sonorae TaxID=1940300 RepID=A0A8K0XK96_9AGAR|nr:hypothetical protein BXZ70DRAFT_962867 [Cristinia sonorae]
MGLSRNDDGVSINLCATLSESQASNEHLNKTAFHPPCIITHIHDLPDDVLIAIFLAYRAQCKSYMTRAHKPRCQPYDHFVIAHICRRWMHLSQSTTRFWQWITTIGSTTFADVCLERSKDAPLVVDARGLHTRDSKYGYTPSRLQEWMSNGLLPHAARIQDLTLDFWTLGDWDVGMRLLRNTTSLKSLTLFPLPGKERVADVEPVILQSLQVYRIHHFVQEALAAVPITPALSASLVHLQITMQNPNIPTSSLKPFLEMSTLLGVLRALPLLQILDLRHLNLVNSLPSRALESVSLPSLQILHILFAHGSIDLLMSLLDHIDFPENTCVKLEWVIQRHPRRDDFPKTCTRFMSFIRSKLWPEGSAGVPMRHLSLYKSFRLSTLKLGACCPGNVGHCKTHNCCGPARLDMLLHGQSIFLFGLIQCLPLKDVEVLRISSSRPIRGEPRHPISDQMSKFRVPYPNHAWLIKALEALLAPPWTSATVSTPSEQPLTQVPHDDRPSSYFILFPNLTTFHIGSSTIILERAQQGSASIPNNCSLEQY